MVNVYLDTEHLEKIVALVQDTTASTKLEDHAREALRTSCRFLTWIYR